MKNKKFTPFPQQPTADEFFSMNYIPNSPVGFYQRGGMTNGIAYPQQPTYEAFIGGYSWPKFQEGREVRKLTPEQVAAADQIFGRIDYYGTRSGYDPEASKAYEKQLSHLYDDPNYDVVSKVDSLNNVYPTVTDMGYAVPWSQIFDASKDYNKNKIYKTRNLDGISQQYLDKLSEEERKEFKYKPNPYYQNKKTGGQPCYECGGSYEEGGQTGTGNYYFDEGGTDAMSFDEMEYKKGGWINKVSKSMEKRGTKGSFTKYCGGKVTDECIKRGLNSPDPTTRKRASLAKTFRKIKKEEGGQSGFGKDVSNYGASRKDQFMNSLRESYDNSKLDEQIENAMEMEEQYQNGGANSRLYSQGYNWNNFDDDYSQNYGQNIADFAGNMFGGWADYKYNKENPTYKLEGYDLKPKAQNGLYHQLYYNHPFVLPSRRDIRVQNRRQDRLMDRFLSSAGLPNYGYYPGYTWPMAPYQQQQQQQTAPADKRKEYQEYVDWYNENPPTEGYSRAAQQPYEEWYQENYPNQQATTTQTQQQRMTPFIPQNISNVRVKSDYGKIFNRKTPKSIEYSFDISPNTQSQNNPSGNITASTSMYMPNKSNNYDPAVNIDPSMFPKQEPVYDASWNTAEYLGPGWKLKAEQEQQKRQTEKELQKTEAAKRSNFLGLGTTSAPSGYNPGMSNSEINTPAGNDWINSHLDKKGIYIPEKRYGGKLRRAENGNFGNDEANAPMYNPISMEDELGFAPVKRATQINMPDNRTVKSPENTVTAKLNRVNPLKGVFSGQRGAESILAGIKGISGAADIASYARQSEAAADKRLPDAWSPVQTNQYSGDNVRNTGVFGPDQKVGERRGDNPFTQFYGRDGGQYADGKEYYMDPTEIDRLKELGYIVEYLD